MISQKINKNKIRETLLSLFGQEKTRPAIIDFLDYTHGSQVAFSFEDFRFLKEQDLLDEGGQVNYEIASIAKQLFVSDGTNWILNENSLPPE